MTPIIAFERLFFAVFGQTSPDDINSQRHTRPEWTENLFKLVYGIYMLVSVIVLINLLIAMMSDTYQRIQVMMTSLLYFHVPNLPTIKTTTTTRSTNQPTIQSASTQSHHSSCSFSPFSAKRQPIRRKSIGVARFARSRCGRTISSRWSLAFTCWCQSLCSSTCSLL
jgi:hypothetical protein